MREVRSMFAVMLVMVFLLSGETAFSEEVSELKEMIIQMKKEYDEKIEGMQREIIQLRDQISIQEGSEQDDLKVDERGIDVEYVGRYEGPFEKGGLIVRESSGFGNVSVGGYMDHEYENFEDRTSTFDQHRWILNVGAELGERLRFYSEYEIEHGGPNAPQGGEAKVEQAWADFLINDYINARAGIVLVPFGRYNLYHDSDLQDLTDRPIVDRVIIPTTWSESGAGLWGEFAPFNDSWEELTIGYETYFFNGLDAGFSDTGLRGARGSQSQDNNQFKSNATRVVISPSIGHEFGLSYYIGEYDVSDNYINGIAVDWFNSFDVPFEIEGLVLGPFEIVGEWAYFDIDEPEGTDGVESATGLYLQSNLHFWPTFLDNTFLGRTFEDPTFTFVTRWGWVEIDDDGDAGTGEPNEEQRLTVGLNYRPVESWVFKVEWQINQTSNESLARGDDDGFMASVAMGF